jgi:hypothetical protein
MTASKKSFDIEMVENESGSPAVSFTEEELKLEKQSVETFHPSFHLLSRS